MLAAVAALEEQDLVLFLKTPRSNEIKLCGSIKRAALEVLQELSVLLEMVHHGLQLTSGNVVSLASGLIHLLFRGGSLGLDAVKVLKLRLQTTRRDVILFGHCLFHRTTLAGKHRSPSPGIKQFSSPPRR